VKFGMVPPNSVSVTPVLTGVLDYSKWLFKASDVGTHDAIGSKLGFRNTTHLESSSLSLPFNHKSGGSEYIDLVLILYPFLLLESKNIL
jgi:hypothetical protein